VLSPDASKLPDSVVDFNRVIQDNTTTISSFNWTASFNGGSTQESDSSSSDLFSGSDSADEDDIIFPINSQCHMEMSEEEESPEIIDLTSPETDSESHNHSLFASPMSPVPFSSSSTGPFQRSPSRKQGFDDSTLEISPTQSEEDDSSVEDDSIVRRITARLSVKSSAHASFLYSNVVQFTQLNFLSVLCGSSRALQKIADSVSCIPEISRHTPVADKLAANEKFKFYLTEAIMDVAEITSSLIAMQSRLLLASSLKDQQLDPRCNSFRFQDRHFKVDYPVYEPRNVEASTSSSSSSASTTSDYGGFTGLRIV
jgi:hypothetical protein